MSGVAMPRPMVMISLALFAASAAIEGAITIAVIQAMEKLDAGFVPQPQASNRRTLAVLSGLAIALGGVGFLVASAAPDGIQRLGIQLGLTAKTVLHAPLADYTFRIFRRIALDQKSHGRAFGAAADLRAVCGHGTLAGPP